MQLVWCATRILSGERTYQPGAVVDGIERWPTFTSLKNVGHVEPKMRDGEGRLHEPVYCAARNLTQGGTRYRPGDRVPGVHAWPTFRALRRLGHIVLAPDVPDPTPPPPTPFGVQAHRRKRGRA